MRQPSCTRTITVTKAHATQRNTSRANIVPMKYAYALDDSQRLSLAAEIDVNIKLK